MKDGLMIPSDYSLRLLIQFPELVFSPIRPMLRHLNILCDDLDESVRRFFLSLLECKRLEVPASSAIPRDIDTELLKCFSAQSPSTLSEVDGRLIRNCLKRIASSSG